jgi:hypothetical protein
VGTWGGDGWAYVYDITDLAKPVKTDSVQVDARTINDVTVSPTAATARCRAKARRIASTGW